MKFSIGLVYYSGIDDLEKAITSLCAQKYQDSHFEILIRDQSPHQEGKKMMKKYFPHIQNISCTVGENLFHSGGHNALIDSMNGEYYICGSVDMIYQPEFLSDLSRSIAKNSHHTLFTGKIVQSDTKIIDTAGIEKTWYFRFFDRGHNQPSQMYSQSETVFGSSGALFCISKKNIQHMIQTDGYFFDPDLHYKNDVDLTCRLRLQNMTCWYDAQIYATHNRQVAIHTHKSDFALRSSIHGQKVIVQKYLHSTLITFWQRPFIWAALQVSQLRIVMKDLYRHFQNR